MPPSFSGRVPGIPCRHDKSNGAKRCPSVECLQSPTVAYSTVFQRLARWVINACIHIGGSTCTNKYSFMHEFLRAYMHCRRESFRSGERDRGRENRGSVDTLCAASIGERPCVCVFLFFPGGTKPSRGTGSDVETSRRRWQSASTVNRSVFFSFPPPASLPAPLFFLAIDASS